MKLRRSPRIALGALLSIALVQEPRNAMAAEPPPPAPPAPKALTLSANLLSPFFGAYYFASNLRASSRLGILLNASYFSLENGDWKTHSGTLGAGLSYYLDDTALRGWYLEGFSEFMLSRWRHEPSGSRASVVPGFTLGAVVGYRWIWELGPVVDLGAGAVMLHFPSAHVDTDTGPLASPALTRLYPAIKLDAGWAF